MQAFFAEIARCFDELIGRAIVVRLTIDASASARREGDDRPD